MIYRRGEWCSLFTTLQGGAQGSSPESLLVDREINVLQSCQFSKHFVPRTSFRYMSFPFWWRSMLSSHVVFLLGLSPFIFNCMTTLSIDSSSLLMTRPNHRSLFLSITWTMDSLLVSMIPPELLRIVLSCTLVMVLFKLFHSQWNPILPSPVTICFIREVDTSIVPWPEQFPALIQSHSSLSGHASTVVSCLSIWEQMFDRHT